MSHTRRSGFTLIELLVVVFVLLVLAGLLVPAVQKVRAVADRMACTNNLKMVLIATANVHDVYEYVPSNPGTLDDRFGTTQSFLLAFMT